jgi:acetoin utilization deacetylase AcuC-like enzyme
MDRRYLNHGPGGHPESPARLKAIYDMLESPVMAGKFLLIPPRFATHKEIELVHSPEYVHFIANTAGHPSVMLDPDTETTPYTYETARLAAGGLCNAIDSVMTGVVHNAFAFIRPPGHHAEYDEAAGFCIFNNIAIGARHALSVHHLERILIVDWDVHHGNGTQRTFYESREVLYFSVHQYPGYPGTGAVEEIGLKKGLGYTINVPVSFAAGDAQFLRIFRTLLYPITRHYQPDLILVSAGFDISLGDPLGGMRVTPAGFAAMTRVLMNLADECCAGKLGLTLEGGYDIDGLVQSTETVLLELHDDTQFSEEEMTALEAKAGERINGVIRDVIHHIKPIWQVF